MKIVDFLRQELILPTLAERTKLGVLGELTAQLASIADIDKEQLLKVLLERERLASTAISEGVAIPHGKVGSIKRRQDVAFTHFLPECDVHGLHLPGRAEAQ